MCDKLTIQSSRVLSSFDISDHLLTKLRQNGCNTKLDVEMKSESELKAMCGLNEEECERLASIVRSNGELSDERSRERRLALHVRTVCELTANRYQFITTGCKSMDHLLSAGIQLSRLTQLCGEAGAGKTQICMQMCVNVQLPKRFGGVSGEALYIDTEQKFRPERVVSMAEYILDKCDKSNYFRAHSKNETKLTVEYIHSHIYVKQCNKDAKSLSEFVNNQLDAYLDKYPNVRLVIIDSIAQLFRYDYTGNEKAYELAKIADTLKNLAISKNIAVLITNQVTFNTQLNRNVPALGNVWQSFCSTIIEIKRFTTSYNSDRNCVRRGRLLKSPLFSESEHFDYIITESGVNDI